MIIIVKVEERLKGLLEIGDNCEIDPPEFESEKFLWIFGNLIQEYFADRIYEEVKDKKDWKSAVKVAIEVASDWFGENTLGDWPFHLKWLRKYIRGRWLGERRGTAPEDKRTSAAEKFERKNPKSEASCQWYLGCSNDKELEKDHRWPWSLHGPSAGVGYQWLCRKHNRNWKRNLLFWDNFIPFRDYDKEKSLGELFAGTKEMR